MLRVCIRLLNWWINQYHNYMPVSAELQLVISAIEEILGKKRIKLKSLREKLSPWLRQKDLKILSARNYFYITWTRGMNLQKADDRQDSDQPVAALSAAQITGVLDHIGIMAINLATLPETSSKDAQVLTVIGNLASMVTDEITASESAGPGLDQAQIMEQLRIPFQKIGLRLTPKR